MKPAELREGRSGFPVVCYFFHYDFQGFGAGFSGRAREGERRDILQPKCMGKQQALKDCFR